MKKLIAITLSLLIVMSAAVSLVGATDAAAPAWTTKEPELLITELVPDTRGTGENGYTNDQNQDIFEMFEIYNNSEAVINLYDYCITYNGNNLKSDNFEAMIVEITPFLTNNQYEDKPGNYLDGSTLEWDGQPNKRGDLSNLPKNPDSCLIEPGECVVVWSMFYEPYLDIWNDGKGMSVKDFRTFWKIPDNVKVICWDGNSNTKYGGHDKNFNLKNSACGSYGIAKYSDVLAAAANVEGKTYEMTYRDFEDLVTWSNVDFTTWGLTTMPNTAYTFTYDLDGRSAALVSSLSGKQINVDARRAAPLEAYATPTPGTLDDLQKLTLPGYKVKAGETIKLPKVETIEGMLYDIWAAPKGEVVTAFKINGKEYKPGDTFTADAAGKITVEVVFGAKPETTKPETSAKPTDTKAPDTKAPDTKAPDTKAPETSAKTTEEKKGCGSSVAYAAVALTAMFGAALTFGKKRK